MNKKFSTLVATLLLSGALFTLNAASTTLDDFGKIKGVEMAADGSSLKLTKNVTLSDQKDYLLIDKDDFVLDGAGFTFKGHIVITGNNVTVKNLTVNYHNAFAAGEDGTVAVNKTAITVIAKDVKLDNNVINCSTDHWLANAITIFPTEKGGKIVVTNNTVNKANQFVDNGDGTRTSATGLQIVGDYDLSWTGLSSQTGTTGVSSFDDIELTVSGNDYEECAADYSYTSGWASSSSYTASAQVSPLIENGKVTNGDILAGFISSAAEDATITFNGTADQLEEALEGQTLGTNGNIAINTNDGPIVSGVAQLQPTIETPAGDFDLVKTPSADEYYLLVRYVENYGSYIVTVDEEGNVGEIKEENLTAAQASNDRNLWKMEQTLDADDDYTFIFTNKADQKLTVKGEHAFHSTGNAPYNNGVVFNNAGANMETEKNRYYGLYKSALHILTAGELSQIEGDGFSITIKPDDLVGNPFDDGRLTPMSADDITEVAADGEDSYYLQNEDGDYIVAKLFGAEGGNKNQAYYVFTTVSEEDLVKDLAKATKDRTLFGQFKMYYKPTSADDDMLEIKSIESMKVEVLNNSNRLAYAPIGYANISTTDQTEKTLTASLKSAQYEITITVGNNIVDPTAFLKKAFYTVTKIDEKEGNTILAVTSCDVKVDPKFVESVGNDLEAQWAITYDEKAATYTFKNREQVGTEWVVNVNALREDDNTKDDIYVIDGVSYQIATVADAKEDDGYMWLGDVKNQRYAMGYYVKALEEGEYLWFVGDKEGNISFEKSNDASVATEMVADTEVDTVKVESVITYYDATKKKFETAKPVLKVPVYAFANVEGENFGYNGKQYAFGVAVAEQLTIREDNGQYNLRLADATAFENGKIYAGASADYLDKTNCVYDDTKNDLFTVEALNRPEYRRLGATVENDGLKDMDVNTVKINRSNDENTYLYENSANRNANNGDPILNFLGETNLADQPENASLAIFVDTAYVRNETTEPLYLLSVRNSFVEGQEAVPCPDHGFDPDCPHWTPATPDHRVGAYLVGLADSTETVEQAMYQGNVRLAFVDATHVGDSLIIDNSKFTGDKKLAKNDTLSFVNAKGEQVENHATFSFRLVDPASTEGDFYIETVNNQYVRIHNSVPVLVSNLDEAATFNIAQTDEAATSNDEISTSEVKVIAGAGQITISGAAGKKVVVSNILGQVVANTVITSDNATIAAPQGIVVVAVEGEEAVKAIVK